MIVEIKMQNQFYHHLVTINHHLRRQSLPMFGSGQRHFLSSESQKALPGQSSSLLHLTISIHFVFGSGSATVPSGQAH